MSTTEQTTGGMEMYMIRGTERWKDVAGYEGLYQISDLGNIRSFHWGKDKPIKPFLDTNGYPMVVLRKDGIRKHCMLHRLVAEAFIPNPENKPYVNHMNAVPTDPRIENLEWCTQKENVQHTVRMGRQKVPRTNKLTESQVSKIKQELSRGVPQDDIASQFNVSRSAVTDINIGRTWKDVSACTM